MSGATTTVTGPLTLKRWQQPAALSRAGFAPADPYPLRGLIFCATWDQPFFPSPQPDGSRAYRSLCGCRLRPLPAGQIELRTYAEAQHLALGTDAATGSPLS
jgi:hypothetical protein